MDETKVDVLINVFGKPYQTALAILSLLKWSGSRIDKIYFHEEPYTSEFERKDHSALLAWIKDRLIHYHVPFWLSSNTTDEERMRTDDQYRLSMRYQYGWEHTQKKIRPPGT